MVGKAIKPLEPTVIDPQQCRRIGEGDCNIVYDAFPDAGTFESLKAEANWQRMLHASGDVPRLVCCQGHINVVDGSIPLYRHPSDRSLRVDPCSPTVESMRAEVGRRVGHTMNHVLIQLYRSGDDHISEHSDKTLDIARGSAIVNVSFGAERKKRLRTKRVKMDDCAGSRSSMSDRKVQIISMPHGSMFVLGSETNQRWLHGIKQDRRPISARSPAENAFGGERISLTFRDIATFLNKEGELIWGQGAVSKTRNGARAVTDGDEKASRELLYAFGMENQHTTFDWDGFYSQGFDIHHLHGQDRQ